VNGNNETLLRVRWYYTPEQTKGGRLEFHGSKELFLSEHYDDSSPEVVVCKCNVHTLKEYEVLENVGDKDFLCRWGYKAAVGIFSPKRVTVYCRCKKPNNPDDLMFICDNCEDWFHPRCIGTTADDIRSMHARIGAFVCPDCSQNMAGERPTQ
jgi:hypothetical protein